MQIAYKQRYKLRAIICHALCAKCVHYAHVTVPGKRAQVAHFFKIELLLPQGRVGFEIQNALHI